MTDSNTTDTQVPDFAEFTASTLKTELMAITLDELKAAVDVWHLVPEQEQDEVINRIERRVHDAVVQTIRLISGHGFTRIPASIESITIKDGIKLAATVSRTDAARHDLIDAQGSIITLVIADLSEFTDSPHSHAADPDQGELRLEKQVGDILKRAADDSRTLDDNGQQEAA